MTFIALLVAWQAIIVGFEVKPFIAPSPIAVLQVIGSKPDVLAANLATTALESILGFLLGNLAATAIAVAFVYRETLEETCFPIAVAFNTIPIVASILANVIAAGITVATSGRHALKTMTPDRRTASAVLLFSLLRPARPLAQRAAPRQ